MNWKRFNIKEIDWSKVGTAIKETMISIGQGSFLLRLRVDKAICVQLVKGADKLEWHYYGSVGSEWSTSLASL